jgi:glycosyltransferase involved in cell wall biosynthesis
MPARYAAIIPCYNVGKACIPVVTRTAPQVDFCVVVDDGSTDDTTEVLSKLKLNNLQILRHPKNMGKGSALVTGFRFVLQEHAEVDAVFTLDGDGQHDPSLISDFKEMFEQNRPDLIYGNRMLNASSMPAGRRSLNRFSNSIMTRICGQQIFDSQCGFRLYSKNLLNEVLNDLHTGTYVFETEILIQACRKGVRIGTVPISTIYSEQSKVLSHHNLLDVLRIARLMLAHSFRRSKN